MLDPETNLEIGKPDRLPFGDIQEIDLAQLHKNVEKRIKFGIASASGIRQIFDATHGDEATDYVDGTGAEITDAAKVHIATITDSFVKLLKEHAGKPQLTVVVAIDSRHTGPAIADIAIRVLTLHGTNIKYAFIIPVTEAAVYSREVADGFIYISASHNPKGYNGLKLGLNDGRVLPGDLARSFIDEYQERLRKPENTKAIIEKVNSAKPDMVREVYESARSDRKEAHQIYARFSDQIITSLKNPEEVAKRKEYLREQIARRDLWIGLDPNGGARQDKEYLESWGFHVLEINNRPRIDMVHELAPTPAACEQAREAMIKWQKEGRNIMAFMVFDTDGDRRNVVLPDGKGGTAIPGVQIIFALDVLCSILEVDNTDHKRVGVAVNDCTSSIMEQLAYYLDFTVKRVEVGEANVATGGQNLYKQGINVPIMGEGSNGSVFNMDLMVREPLHTVRTFIDFITRPELVKTLLRKLNQGDMYDNWHSPERINSLFYNIVNALPISATTNFFTDEGIRRSDSDLPDELLKANFDAYFETELWPRIAEEIRKSYGGEPIAEFVNYEGEEELRGKGNRKTGTGGYKVEFSTAVKDGDKRHIGWIWFRSSATERGVMRRGVSISHWEMTPQAAEAVKQLYKSMNGILNEALNTVEEKTLGSLQN